MGSAYSSSITKVEVSKSPTGQDQSVVYSTPDSRTCTLQASVGVNAACVSLRDYTFDREGTRVQIWVRDIETNKEGVKGVGAIDVKYGGSALEVRKDAGQFCIGYGVPHVWYDAAKGSFMCNITGPSRHASFVEVAAAMKKAYDGDGVVSPSSTAHAPSPSTSIINNSGRFHGPLNGSMISDSTIMMNFFNVYLSSK